MSKDKSTYGCSARLTLTLLSNIVDQMLPNPCFLIPSKDLTMEKQCVVSGKPPVIPTER